MGELQIKHLFWGIFLEPGGTFQAVFLFLLIPCSLTVDYRAAPIIPNTTFLWVWNVPTEACVGNVQDPIDLSFFSFVGSPRKTATGQPITLFYVDRLGLYPHIDTKQVEHHGGIPQRGDLQSHLVKAKGDIEHYIPVDNVGLAVIDWEEWRPTWLRNWKPKDNYRNKSIELVQSMNAGISISEATQKAKEQFEMAGKNFMERTLQLGRFLRPKHLWGFYLFPDCYNNKFQDPKYDGQCPDVEKKRNNDLNWLWKVSTGLYPSVYLKKDLKSNRQAALYVRYRVVESIRVSKVGDELNPVPSFVYIRLVFTDAVSEYLQEDDLVNTIGEIVALGPSGIIIWDAMTIAQRAEGCPILHKYMRTTLNPYILNVTLAAKMCSQTLCNEKGLCSRKNESSDVYLHLNPSSFNIKLTETGKYEVHGNPRAEDLVYFSEHFKCSCFSKMTCEETSNIKNVQDVNVCIGDNVCIKAKVEPNPAFALLPGKSFLFMTTLAHMLHHLPQDIFVFPQKMLVSAF
ncbi:hyaluronidase PH-20-like [Arvicanthis niloticus]|uniref:hyaluronidase PH-20-like n=1 Tax=Arvicanthis niloticus TaxID=61156 RepID=UPI00148601DC|nr:hyaluronidase PH-20-like [Arvicanthis niloticus]XP_034375444.1 hyaluronidase PH-20-like [Arvicanthis niloticus]XP_034375445.1 hyaluronidase PH-20-like [Arvicanthis niloticus]XP_034375446.1 hyaluronidase PH-20-like [Arvicanthis niloticus]